MTVLLGGHSIRLRRCFKYFLTNTRQMLQMFLDVVAHDLKERSPQSLCAFMHMIKITHYVLAVHALEHGGGFVGRVLPIIFLLQCF